MINTTCLFEDKFNLLINFISPSYAIVIHLSLYICDEGVNQNKLPIKSQLAFTARGTPPMVPYAWWCSCSSGWNISFS